MGVEAGEKRGLSPITWRMVWMAVCLFVVSLHVSAEDWDVYRFIPPVGWKVVRTQGSVLFTRATNTDFAQLEIFKSRSGSSDMLVEFGKDWRDLVENRTSAQIAEAPEVADADDGWRVAFGRALVKQKTNHTVVLFTFVGHGRVASALLRGTDQSMLDQATEEFKRISLLDVVPTVVQSAPAVPATRSLTGLWRGDCRVVAKAEYNFFTHQMEMKLAAGETEIKEIAFLDGGGFTVTWPSGGLRDAAAARASEPNYWGTYHISGNSGVVKFDDGGTYPIQLRGDRVVYDNCEYVRVGPLQ
jgi:hypothetical protein